MVDGVGIKVNFFDLGGHSLLATQLISKINREFNVQFQLKLLFDLGNIKELSGVLDVIKNNDSTQAEDKDNLREEFMC
jgi:acyl carrier protein